jgi:hypothetical protein
MLPSRTALAASLALAFALASPAVVVAQAQPSVTGRVTGAAGEPLAGARVRATAPGVDRAATTAADGRYTLPVPPGAYTLRAELLGYEPQTRAVRVDATGARADFTLAVRAVELPTLEVAGARGAQRERARFETEAGITARVITGEEMKILPGLGEADVLRAVEVLPGVISTSDFSSAFNVRGGSADQNLILLDGFPIYNPFHLGGLFSVFNSDVVARAELFSGGFGAEYGGRVSSVLTVESTTEAPARLEGDAGVSILATRLALRRRLPDGIARGLGGTGGSWYVSGRRSYLDALVAPVANFPYHLTDGQAGATLDLRGGGRLQFTGYTGEDVLDLSDFTPPGGGDTSILRFRWNWGNDVAGLRWIQPVGRRWVADTRLGWSRYGERLGFVDFDDTQFGSTIAQTTLATDLRRSVAPGLTLGTGGSAGRLSYRNRGESGGTVFFEGGNAGVMGAAYGQALWEPSSRWLLEGGVRADGWWSGGADYLHLSPRLAAKRFLGDTRSAAVKLAAGRYVQFLHSLRDEQLPVSNDTWVTADAHVPPVVSDQVQIGIEKWWGDAWNASVETYYRTFRGVTEFNPADDPNDPADDLLTGTGRSYGLDVLVRRSTGALRGWVAVSLLRARRTMPDPLALGLDDLPQTVTFAPVWDRRADVDLVLSYDLPRGVESGLRWNVGTGVPYSRPVGQFVAFETSILDGGYRVQRPRGDDDSGVPVYIVPGERNRQRYPTYHRLDATVRKPYTRRWGTLTPYLQVLNVYDRRNVLFYFYNYDAAPPVRSGISMFPVIPTIGVEVSF